MMNSILICVVFLVATTSFVNGHSQMRCAKYNAATGQCSAPIRNQAVSYGEEAYLYTNGAPICQSPMSNPISAAYSNGAGCPDWAPCPAPMGNYAPGETFTIMWLARNHAVADQNPATIRLYLSPKESQTQGQDVSASTFLSNMICSGPYMNCGGQNVDFTPCTLTCTMPSSVSSGVYTLLWKWDWQGSMYTTCADITVSGAAPISSNSNSNGGGSVTTAAVKPATTGKLPATTGKPASTTTTTTTTTTTGVQPATTGKQQAQPTTTGKPPVPPVTTGVRSVTTGDSTALCYKPGTKNLNGKINKSGYCGKNAPRARCADGQCCSEYGYCGPFKDADGSYYQYSDNGSKVKVSQDYATYLYCNRTSSGDYRKVPCNTVKTGVPAGAELLGRSGACSNIMMHWVLLFGIVVGIIILF